MEIVTGNSPYKVASSRWSGMRGNLIRYGIPAAVIVVLGLSALFVMSSRNAAPPILRSSVSPNQWECAAGDPAGACTATDITAMPTAQTTVSSAVAPCPASADSCVYALGANGTVEAYDTATNTWVSSDTGGSCANAGLACMPAAATGFAAATTDCPNSSADTCLYAVGGGSTGAPQATLRAYDTATNTWTSSDSGGACANTALPCMPTARTGAAAVTGPCPLSDDQCVYAIGGATAGGTASAAVEAYDPATNTWTSSETGGSCANAASLACLPSARTGLAASAAPCPDSEEWCLYAIAGSNGSAVASVDAYYPGGNIWTSSNDGGSCASPDLACLPASVTHAASSTGLCPSSTDTCVYVTGGDDGSNARSTNVAYDPATNTWISSDTGGACANSAISCMPTARSGASATAAQCPSSDDTCLYVLGGSATVGGSDSGVVEAYDSGQDSASGESLYVSPKGSDNNPGTQSQPIRTLAHARDLVRSMATNMSTNITVFLKNGTYRLSSALYMGPQDSGTNGHTITWRSMPGQHAIVSGADQIGGWTLSDKKKGIWSAPVPHTLQTRQLYVNADRAQLAAGTPPVKLTTTSTGYRASSATMSKWHNPSSIDFVYLAQIGLMAEPICPVKSIHGTTITMAQPCWDNSNKRVNNIVGFGKLGTPDYIENAYELLDQPGEFYLDSHSHTMYYMPRAGQNMKTADVEAPALQTLIEGDGTKTSAIQNVTFSGIEFTYATWLQPSSKDGFSDMQANYTLTGKGAYAKQGLCKDAPHGSCPFGAWTKEPGNVRFSYDSNLSFLNDKFIHLGAAGLNLDDGSHNAVVTGCVFTDISGNGLEVGSTDLPSATGSSQTTGITVSNNHIYGVPAEFLGGVGMFIGYVATTTISHNQIDHNSYTALTDGWGGWVDKKNMPTTPNFSHDNTISNNYVGNFMQVMSDGGGIYTQGITGNSFAHGLTVSGNVVHDQLAWGRALQADDGSTYITYTGNALYNDNYDWGSNHIDFRDHKGNFDPLQIKNNYWQQDNANSSDHGVVQSGNRIITGPADIPNSIANNAGLQHHYRYLLYWNPPGNQVPNRPERLWVLYAYGGKVYLTWRPSYIVGDSPITSYTITSCRVKNAYGPCVGAGASPVTITDSDYNNNGYAVISGLSTGKQYAFTVKANSSSGSSTASMPIVAPVTNHSANTPGPVLNLDSTAGQHLVRLVWYAPSSSAKQPITAYKVTDTDGDSWTISSLRELIVANQGGHVEEVFSGLTPGHAYTFKVAAITPAGQGPTATAPNATPTN